MAVGGEGSIPPTRANGLPRLTRGGVVCLALASEPRVWRGEGKGEGGREEDEGDGASSYTRTRSVASARGTARPCLGWVETGQLHVGSFATAGSEPVAGLLSKSYAGRV